MKVEIKQLPKSQVEFEIELEADEFNGYFKKAVSKISANLKFDGFRAGKAPQNIVEEAVGEAGILDEAANQAVRQAYIHAIDEKNIKAVSQPEITVIKLAKNNPFVFKAKVAVLPEISLPDYLAIVKKVMNNKQKVEITEKEITEALDYLVESRSKYSTVLRGAEKGDRVEIDFLSRLDGKEMEGGKSKNHPLVIGQGRFIPGFEEELIGMKEKDVKKFTLKFPKDYHKKELSEKLVDFEVMMNLVQKIEKPVIDDEFAKSLGKFTSVEELKKNINSGILQEKEQKERDKIRKELILEIGKKTKVEIPDALVNRELDKMLMEFEDGAAKMGLEFDEYLKQLGKTKDQMKAEWQAQARERVLATLVLMAIADEQKIEPKPDEIEDEVNAFLMRYQNATDAKRQIDLGALREYTKSVLKNEKVFEYLEKICPVV